MEDGKEVEVVRFSHCSPACSSRKTDCNDDSQNDGTKTGGSSPARNYRATKNHSKQDSEAEDPPVVTVDS